MQHFHVKPGKGLSHSIESYVFLKTYRKKPILDSFFPNGKAAVVFHFKDPFCFRTEPGQWQTMSRVNFIGCQSIPVLLKNAGTIDTLTVLLYPYALHNLFHIHIKGPIQHQAADDHFPDALISKLSLSESAQERSELLDDFFHNKLANYDPFKDQFKIICDCIIQNKGCIERKELSDRFGLSENYIHKLFIRKIGLSFKPYAQLVRISNVLSDVNNNSHDWMDLLLQYGFYDQAHFIKEFKKITGKTPLQYYKGNKFLSTIFTSFFWYLFLQFFLNYSGEFYC